MSGWNDSEINAFEHYLNFIDNVRNNLTIKEGEYYETHHIIPKCWNGSDEDSNLIKLTFSLHIIAHYLLAKTNNIKAIRGFAHILHVRRDHNSFLQNDLSEIADNMLSKGSKVQIVNLNTGKIYPSFNECWKELGYTSGASLLNVLNHHTPCPKDNCYYARLRDVNDNDYVSKIEELKDLQKERQEKIRENQLRAAKLKRKSIIRLSDEKIYSCREEAAKDNSCNVTSIGDAIMNKTKVNNSFWMLLDDYDSFLGTSYYESKFEECGNVWKRRDKKIRELNSNLLFNSTGKAAKYFNISNNSVRRSIKTKRPVLNNLQFEIIFE